MGYKVLVTLDLPGATDEQRKIFYQVLAKANWIKINLLTTAWKISFVDSASRDGVISTVKADLQNAKNQSKVKKVEYALQLDKLDLVISSL